MTDHLDPVPEHRCTNRRPRIHILAASNSYSIFKELVPCYTMTESPMFGKRTPYANHNLLQKLWLCPLNRWLQTSATRSREGDHTAGKRPVNLFEMEFS